MRSRIVRISVPLLTGACCSVASATLQWQKTFTTGPNGVVQFESGGGNNMIGPVSNNQLPVTTVDNGTNAYTPDKAGEPLGATVTGHSAFSGLYNFDWSNMNTNDDTNLNYEAVGFLGTAVPQTRQIMGAILRHWHLSPSQVTGNEQAGYYVGLDLAFGSVGIVDFGYNGSTPAIFLGTTDPTPTMQLAIGFDPTSNTLSTGLYDGSGNLLGAHSAVINRAGGMYGAHPASYDTDANIQSELNNLSASYLGWEDYTGNGNDIPNTWNMNSLSYYNDATGAFTAATANAQLIWNNTGGTGDGVTWDTTNQNWNAGSPAIYSDGSKVLFNDTNNAHYAVTLNTTVSPAAIVVNNSAGNYTFSGTGKIAGTGSLTKSGSGTLTLSTANTYSGGTTVNAGVLEIMPTSATTSALPKGALTITGTGTVQLATNVTLGSQSSPTPASNVNITSLSITGSGTLDITNNHIIIDYVAGSDPIASIASLIHSGFAGGTWAGTGITSSSAVSGPGYGIGYADAADPGNPAGLASGQIEIAYTLLGDANLDGAVNGSDFAILATNFNKAVSGWDAGDFNYDGAANGSDFALLASNFNKGASQAADLMAVDSFAAANGLSASVPEPVSIGLMTMGAAGLLARRQHRLKA